DTLMEQRGKARTVPLAALQTRATKEQQRFSAYGTLKSALDAVSTAAAALGKGETYNAVTTSVTGDSFTASAKAGSVAIAGNYAISVDNLAKAQVLSSDGVAERNKPLVTGSGKVDITFTVGLDENGDPKTHTISVDAGKSSLEDVAKPINADSKLGVSATLMNDGTDTPHRRLLSADNTGTDNRITAISASVADGQYIRYLENVLS